MLQKHNVLKFQLGIINIFRVILLEWILIKIIISHTHYFSHRTFICSTQKVDATIL
ncbi:MAG: hypothetical protein ACI8YQ_001376 [Polaribacter sp.]|jgi:hypothetical protein